MFGATLRGTADFLAWILSRVREMFMAVRISSLSKLSAGAPAGTHDPEQEKERKREKERERERNREQNTCINIDIERDRQREREREKERERERERKREREREREGERERDRKRQALNLKTEGKELPFGVHLCQHWQAAAPPSPATVSGCLGA